MRCSHQGSGDEEKTLGLDHIRHEVWRSYCNAEESPSGGAIKSIFISVAASKAQKQQHLLRAETAAGSSIGKGEEATLRVAILEVCSGQSACNHVRPEGPCRLRGNGPQSRASGAQRESDAD